MGDRTFMIVKGPSRFGANLGLMMRHFKFLASSHTLSPSLNGVKERRVRAAITCQARSWAAKASLRAAERVLKRVSMAGMAISEITEGRAWGSYPIMR